MESKMINKLKNTNVVQHNEPRFYTLNEKPLKGVLILVLMEYAL